MSLLPSISSCLLESVPACRRLQKPFRAHLPPHPPPPLEVIQIHPGQLGRSLSLLHNPSSSPQLYFSLRRESLAVAGVSLRLAKR